ncbi:MAG: hypothetical protein JXB62_22025 [Pirellulales bacterium]|nr:hypothetical protein [Pirellulales bacterium]
MTPTLKLPMLKSQTFTALKLTATQVALVGIDEVQLDANHVVVDVNVGPKWTGTASGMGPAVVKFATSFPSHDSDPAGYPVRTGTTSAPVYIDFDGKQLGASIEQATLKISEFVHITGSIAVDSGPARRVDVTGGLLSSLGDGAGEFLTELGLPSDFADSFPALSGTTTQLGFMTIGAANVHAFVGMDGPYWTDLDGDRHIGWAFNTGDGDDASRTITSGTVTIDSVVYDSANPILPANTLVTLVAADGVVAFGSEADGTDVRYGDINGDTKVAADETAELNAEAVGLVINDFDFGMAIMTPKNPLDFAKYFALKASCDMISLVGIDGMTVKAEDILVEVNQSSPSVYGLPLFPVVDFANTAEFASEELALFDTNGDGVITLGELATLNSTNSAGFTALTSVALDDSTPVDHEMLLGILNTNDIGDSRGVMDIVEAAALLADPNDSVAVAAAVAAAEVADGDGDGKIDPLGFEVNTGGDPVYLSMDSPLIRAQGFLELGLFGSLILTGSIAFELGPTQEVTLTDDESTPKTVTTMTIGAANVTAFVGVGGPYWTDLDGDHKVSWSDADGNPLTQAQAGSSDTVVDANETAELDEDAIGLHITDLDLGLMVMASTEISDPGVYLAAKASVDSFGFVGVDQVEATGTFDIALNLGIGTAGLAVVDFPATFGEDEDLNDNGVFDGEESDLDGDGVVDQGGFEVNTGDPNSPVLLDFAQFLISFQLGGIVTIYTDTQKEDRILRLNGLALFEADDTGLGLFVAAGLEFGPDIVSGDKLFDMNALGGLVINESGIAADIDVSVAIGGSLSSSMSLGASLDARVVFNSTGSDQEITIPARYVEFLDGTVDLSDSYIGSGLDAQGSGDVTALEGLTGTLDSRFTVHQDDMGYEDGSATFTIFGTAPTLAALFPDADLPGGSQVLGEDGPYFAVAIEGELTISDNWGIHGCFGLIVVDSGFQMIVDASLELGSIGALGATGVLIVDTQGVRARVTVDGTLGSDNIGLTIGAHGLFELNTTAQNWDVYDNQSIIVPAGSMGVAVSADFDFLGFAEGSGSASVTFADNDFQLVIDGSLTLGSVLDVDVHAYVGIFNDGVIVDAAVDLDVSLLSILTLDVEGRLQINTTATSRTGYRGATIGSDGSLVFSELPFLDANGNPTTIVANTFSLDLLGDLSVLSVISISGQITVQAQNDEWTITIPQAHPLTADLFGVFGVTVYGSLESSGEFDLHLAGYVNLAWAGNGFTGSVNIHTTFDVDADPDFTFSASGGVNARVGGVNLAGANVGLDASGDLGESIPITLTVEGNGVVFQVVSGIRSFFRWIVTGRWVSRRLGFSIPLGTIRLPDEIVTEPEVTPPLLAGKADGSAWNNDNPPPDGILYLNVGDDRASRRTVEPFTEAEQYTITRLDSGTIRIAAFGEIEDFEGVSAIVGDFGSGNDAVNFNVGRVNATVSGGSGNDSLYYGGTGQASLSGNEGDDRLTIDGTPSFSSALYGGPGNDTLTNASAVDIALYGEDGGDTLMGGAGNDSVLDGGAGNDWIRGREGRDSMFGGADVDKLVVEISDLELFETVDGGADEDQIAVLGDSLVQDLRVTMDNNVVKISSYVGAVATGSVTLANLEAVVLSGGEGADGFSVAGELELGGVNTVVVDMGSIISESGHSADGAIDQVHLILSDNADEFELTPANMGVQGLWKDSQRDHFTFSVLTGYASDGDMVNVYAGGDFDSIKVLVPPTYGACPESSCPASSPQQVYLTHESDGRFGPTYSFHNAEAVIVGDSEGEPTVENDPLTVDTTEDVKDGDYSAGNLSLREAVEFANANPGADTILFAAALAEKTITLTSGELVITDDLTITGLGADQLTISGGSASRVFTVDNAAPTAITVAIRGLSLVEGHAPVYPYGGGIYNQEHLTVEGCTLANNAAVYGGGIRNDGTLTVTDSTFEDNSTNYGGGIRNDGTLSVTSSTFANNEADWGGGIYSEYGALTVTNSTFENNAARNGQGGGLFNDGTLTVTDTTFGNNWAYWGGGGICSSRQGTASVANSTFENNTARSGGGICSLDRPLAVTDSTLRNNSAVEGGGGIYCSGTTTVANSTIEGNAARDGSGGGIFSYRELTVINSTIAYNSVDGTSGDMYLGGGIYNYGTAVVRGSRIENNSANYGGGIHNYGTLTVTNSTIAYNSANGDGFLGGGGIANYYATVTITNSTLNHNRAVHAGGISNYFGGTATVTNCTLAYNTADYTGGGIVNLGTAVAVTNSTLAFNSANYAGGLYNDFGTLSVTNSTIAHNSANGIGGIMNYETLIIANSLVSGNTASYGRSDINNQGTTAAQHNVIQDGADSGIVDGENGNQVGIDPLLDPAGLQDHGGPTQTIALLPGSPAINAGDNDRAVDPEGNPLTTDQRGEGFARVFGGIVDIGAYELQELVVSTLTDEADADYRWGCLSLREALAIAETQPGKDVVWFAPNLSGGTIELSLGQLAITSNLELLGLGVTIDAARSSRVLIVDAAVTDATLRDLTITGGYTSGSGAGILNYGTLSVVNSNIAANSSGWTGGGLYNEGTLRVVDSTISGNETRHGSYSGGGIRNQPTGTLWVVNSTISGNSSAALGGGIFNYGTLSVANSTIVDNTADAHDSYGTADGGGIATYGDGSIALHNTIVAGNVRGTAALADDLSGHTVQDGSSYNLIGDAAGSSGLIDGVDGNIVGVEDLSWLLPLDDYGGPALTHALLPGSPAIDAGDPDFDPYQFDPLLLTDQRGCLRIADGDGDTTPRIDIGAFEFAPAMILSRHVFYNQSAFDGDDPAADARDDDAIAPDKTALLPGQAATFVNYTSYSRGINGIMIDIEGLPGIPSVVDFAFRVGNTDDPSTWACAPDPSSLSVRPGDGIGGSDRITLIWPEYAIRNQWLQVTVLANGNTNLAEPDVFYVGNAVADAGNSTTDAKVNATDMLLARNNPRTFLNPAAVDFPYDYNRDARVNATDMLLARNNQTHFLNALKLITVPSLKATGEKTAAVGREAIYDTALEMDPSQQPASSRQPSTKLDWLYACEPTRTATQSPKRDGNISDAVEQLLQLWPS